MLYLEVKDDTAKYEETITELKRKDQLRKIKQISYWSSSQAEYMEQNSNTKRKRFRRAASLFLKSYLNKMLFFGIVFVLYFFDLSEKSGF